MRAPVARSVAGLLAVLAACSPALDWREVRVDDAGFVARFPCRPQRVARGVTIAGLVVRMQMLSCSDDGITYAASWADVDDPQAVHPVLEALRHAAAANLGMPDGAAAPFALAGATPNDASARVMIQGHLPDGRAVQEHAAFFPRGLRVYQASLIGPAPSSAAIEGFFAGLAFRR
ncbi:MAG TPA: hypothetical protein VMU47_12740 [Caldimonas sp.]|nr:hypothetical protein [Caldimonas sp.]